MSNRQIGRITFSQSNNDLVPPPMDQLNDTIQSGYLDPTSIISVQSFDIGLDTEQVAVFYWQA